MSDTTRMHHKNALRPDRLDRVPPLTTHTPHPTCTHTPPHLMLVVLVQVHWVCTCAYHLKIMMNIIMT